MRNHYALAVLAFTLPTTALADWASGTPYSQGSSWPDYNSTGSNNTMAYTFDNFTWTPGAGGGVIDTIGGFYHAFNTESPSAIDSIYWEIRTGMSDGVAGTLIASGNTGLITPTTSSFLQGGATVAEVSVDIPDFALPAGNYWFALGVGSISPDDNSWFNAQTDGTGGIGGPLGDNQIIYYQATVVPFALGWNYVDPTAQPWWSQLPDPHVDPSYYIREVPAPSAFAVLTLAGIAAGRRRR